MSSSEELMSMVVSYGLWGVVVLIWFWFCHKMSTSSPEYMENEDDVEGGNHISEIEQHRRTRLTEEEKEKRRKLILSSLITKRIGAEKQTKIISDMDTLTDNNTTEKSTQPQLSKTFDGDILTKKSREVSSGENIERNSNKMPRSSSFSELLNQKPVLNCNRKTIRRHSENFVRHLSFASSLGNDSIISQLEKESTGEDDSIFNDRTDKSKTENVCPICLSEFQYNEKISSSPNEECSHSFHQECIVKWLMNDDDCPCCRRNFLVCIPARTEEVDNNNTAVELGSTGEIERINSVSINSSNSRRLQIPLANSGEDMNANAAPNAAANTLIARDPLESSNDLEMGS